MFVEIPEKFLRKNEIYYVVNIRLIRAMLIAVYDKNDESFVVRAREDKPYRVLLEYSEDHFDHFDFEDKKEAEELYKYFLSRGVK